MFIELTDAAGETVFINVKQTTRFSRNSKAKVTYVSIAGTDHPLAIQETPEEIMNLIAMAEATAE